MTTHLEIEFKTLLTNTEYELIRSYFSLQNTSPIKQTNIYFDTEDWFLKNKHIVLRVRIKEEMFELTLKIKSPKGNIEINEPITKEVYYDIVNKHILPDGVIKLTLKELNIDFASVKAELTTYRYELEYKNCLIALDKSYYYDQFDYELELEAPDYDYGLTIFNELLEKFNLTLRKAKPKAVRAIEYNQQKNPR